MKCKQCGKTHSNKAFCSHQCRNEWTRSNNITNNPIWNKQSLEKMRLSKQGSKASDETKAKMSATRKQIIKENPDAIRPMLLGAEKKYLSKVRGTGWRLLRLKVLDRDSYKCQSCGESQRSKLLVHHIDWQGKRDGVPTKDWNNDMSNLVTLCQKCHNGIHRHKSKDYHERMSKISP